MDSHHTTHHKYAIQYDYYVIGAVLLWYWWWQYIGYGGCCMAEFEGVGF